MTEKILNSCDGCQRGLPLIDDEFGLTHKGEGYDIIGCTKDRYQERTCCKDCGLAHMNGIEHVCDIEGIDKKDQFSKDSVVTIDNDQNKDCKPLSWEEEYRKKFGLCNEDREPCDCSEELHFIRKVEQKAYERGRLAEREEMIREIEKIKEEIGVNEKGMYRNHLDCPNEGDMFAGIGYREAKEDIQEKLTIFIINLKNKQL